MSDFETDAALSWAKTQLGVDQLTFARTRPWAEVWSVETEERRWWLKINSLPTGYEPRLIELLQTTGTTLLAESVVHPDQPWALIADGGVPARSALDGAEPDELVVYWSGLLVAYAELQQDAAALDLAGIGVPDFRPEVLGERFDELIADQRWLDPAVDPELTDADRERIFGARTPVVEAARALADTMPASVDHGDLHDGNVFRRDDRSLIIDWGDATLAHPFSTLLVTLDVLAAQLQTTADDPRLRPVADAYLDCWRSGGESRSELHRQLRLARQTAALSRAASWRRALVEPAAGIELDFADAVAQWLLRLVDRLTP